MTQRNSRSKSPTRTVREGAVLYNTGPRTSLAAEIVERGRQRQIHFLSNLTAPRCVNSAHYKRTVKRHGVLTDVFSVQCGSLDGFRPTDLSTARKHYDVVSFDNALWKVYCPQSKYTGAVFCLDLSRCQCLLVVLLLLLAVGLLLMALDVDFSLRNPEHVPRTVSWFADSYADQQPIESAFD